MTRPALAAFYARNLFASEAAVWQWDADRAPRRLSIEARGVAIAKRRACAVDRAGRLWTWEDAGEPAPVLEDVVQAAIGETGLLAVGGDGTLWRRDPEGGPWREAARDVRAACVGDSSDYYVTREGDLYATGLAHRGQYGDGSLEPSHGWRRVARGVRAVCAHTGHAVLLREDGRVEGTGGNRFGPLSHHGIGDKADRWGCIFEGAIAIDTGARHSAALRADRRLWIWGEHEGLDPHEALDGVVAFACGDCDTVALDAGGRLYRWATGERPRALPWWPPDAA